MQKNGQWNSSLQQSFGRIQVFAPRFANDQASEKCSNSTLHLVAACPRKTSGRPLLRWCHHSGTQCTHPIFRTAFPLCSLCQIETVVIHEKSCFSMRQNLFFVVIFKIVLFGVRWNFSHFFLVPFLFFLGTCLFFLGACLFLLGNLFWFVASWSLQCLHGRTLSLLTRWL